MNSNLLRGSLETIVMKLLSDHGEMYGYEITKKVKELTDEKLIMTEGALYPTLHKMEANGLLDCTTKFENNRFRKYYKITKQGKTAHTSYMEDIKEYLEVMGKLMQPHLTTEKL